MRIYVKVRPNAKRPGISLIAEGHLSVAVKEPPREGKANQAVRRALADHFGVAMSRVALVFGATAHEKVFEID